MFLAIQTVATWLFLKAYAHKNTPHVLNSIMSMTSSLHPYSPAQLQYRTNVLHKQIKQQFKTGSHQ